MRAPTSRARGSLEFNMTPMIDVVLQLIVFFLVAGHLAQQEWQMELNLPGAASGRQPDEQDQSRRIIVNVLPGGGIQLSGQPVTVPEFGRRIRAERTVAEGELEVRIRSDRHVPYRTIEPLLLACAKSGVWKVTFAVTKREK